MEQILPFTFLPISQIMQIKYEIVSVFSQKLQFPFFILSVMSAVMDILL